MGEVVELQVLQGGKRAPYCSTCRYLVMAELSYHIPARCRITGRTISEERSYLIDSESGIDVVSCGPNADWHLPRRTLWQWLLGL